MLLLPAAYSSISVTRGGGDFELFRPKSELWRTVDEITFPHYQYKGDVVGPKN